MNEQFLNNIQLFCQHFNINYNVDAGILTAVTGELQLIQFMELYKNMLQEGVMTKEEVRVTEQAICDELLKKEVDFPKLEGLLQRVGVAEKKNDNILIDLDDKVYAGFLFDYQMVWSYAVSLLKFRDLLKLTEKELYRLKASERDMVARLMLSKLRVFVVQKDGSCDLGAYLFTTICENKMESQASLEDLAMMSSAESEPYLTADKLRSYYKYINKMGYKHLVLILDWHQIVKGRPHLEVDLANELIALPREVMELGNFSLPGLQRVKAYTYFMRKLQIMVSASFIVMRSLLNRNKWLINKTAAFDVMQTATPQKIIKDLKALYRCQSQAEECFWSEYNYFSSLYSKVAWADRFLGVCYDFVHECQQLLISDFYLLNLHWHKLVWQQICKLQLELNIHFGFDRQNSEELVLVQKKTRKYGLYLSSCYEKLNKHCFFNIPAAKIDEVHAGSVDIRFTAAFMRRRNFNDDAKFNWVDRLDCSETAESRREYGLLLIKQLATGEVLTENEFVLVIATVASGNYAKYEQFAELTARLLNLCLKKIAQLDKSEYILKKDYLFLKQGVDFFKETQSLEALIEIKRQTLAMYKIVRVKEMLQLHEYIGPLNFDYYQEIENKKISLEEKSDRCYASLCEALTRNPEFIREHFMQVYSKMLYCNITKYYQNIVPNRVIDSYFRKRKGSLVLEEIITKLEAAVIAKRNLALQLELMHRFESIARENKIIDKALMDSLYQRYPLIT